MVFADYEDRGLVWCLLAKRVLAIMVFYDYEGRCLIWCLLTMRLVV